MNPSQDRLGEIVAGHRLGRDALILLGWSGEDMPAHGMAVAQQRHNSRGRFGAVTLTDRQQRHWFLLLIHAPEAGLAQSGDGFQLHAVGARSSSTAYVPEDLLKAEDFAAQLLAHLGGLTGEATRFLAAIYPAMALPPPESIKVLQSALQQVIGQGAARAVEPASIAPPSNYAGQDTISTSPLPLRLVIDHAAHVAGSGCYVTGWLLDPARLLCAISLRDSSGACERLDGSWTRMSRPDVSDCFRQEPLFDGRIADDLHGFAVFVPMPHLDPRSWLELDLGGHGHVYMPLALSAVRDMADRQGVLATVDLHKPVAIDIIERHLGPLFHAGAPAQKTPISFQRHRQSARSGQSAVILPFTDRAIISKLVVSRLAHSQLDHDLRIVVVCSPTIPEVIARLSRDLDFYGIAADVLIADQPVDSSEALDIGVQATTESKLLFLSPHVHGASRSGFVDLLAALGDGGSPRVVSPTLLYEDHSIRYAGIDSVAFLDTPPYGASVCDRAGYHPDSLRHAQSAPTLSAAIECCAMTRSAFSAVGGFSAGYAHDGFKGLDLFLRMNAASIPMIWRPDVVAYAMDDGDAADDRVSRIARLVDGWCFKAFWQKSLSCDVLPADESPVASPQVMTRPRANRGRATAAG